MQARIDKLESEKNEMVLDIKKLTNGESAGAKFRQALLQRKTIDKYIPHKLSGKEESKEMSYFVFGLKRLVENDPGFVDFLDWIERQEDDITKDSMKTFSVDVEGVDVQWMNTELYNVLVGMSVAGSVKDRLMNLDDRKEIRGAQAYFMLTRVCAGNSPNSQIELTQKVLKAGRPKGDPLDHLTSWETSLRRYEAATKHTMDLTMRMTLLYDVLPVDTAQTLVNGDYPEFESALAKAKSILRTAKAKKERSKIPGPDDMDIGMAKQESQDDGWDANDPVSWPVLGEEDPTLGSFQKGGKGKGKGKGGYFNGECNWCKRWGHRERDCGEKDKYMDALRAKGKGGGKGGKGKDGGGKPASSGWNQSSPWQGKGWSVKGGGKNQNQSGKGHFSMMDDHAWMDNPGAQSGWSNTPELCHLSVLPLVPTNNHFDELYEDEYTDCDDQDCGCGVLPESEEREKLKAELSQTMKVVPEKKTKKNKRKNKSVVKKMQSETKIEVDSRNEEEALEMMSEVSVQALREESEAVVLPLDEAFEAPVPEYPRVGRFRRPVRHVNTVFLWLSKGAL